jgi:methionine synthase II (cobalamin-independent)
LLRTLPDCPAWPQLPNRSYRENMYAQYAAPLPGARIDEEASKTRLALPEDGAEVLTEFFTAALAEDPAPFAPAPENAAGYHAFLERLPDAADAPAGPFVKGHVTGPVSFGLTVTRTDDRAVFYDDTLRDVVIQGLAAQARAQVKQLARTGREVVLFIDEPYLSSFGSATVPVSEHDVVDSLTAVTDAVVEAGGIPGVHCCGNTDWSLLFRTSARIINFDAYAYLEGMTLYPDALADFYARGGALAWGIVPTDPGALAAETAETLTARLRQAMERVAASGVDAGVLRESCLVTPACGTGTLKVAEAERAVELAAAVAAALRS